MADSTQPVVLQWNHMLKAFEPLQKQACIYMSTCLKFHGIPQNQRSAWRLKSRGSQPLCYSSHHGWETALGTGLDHIKEHSVFHPLTHRGHDREEHKFLSALPSLCYGECLPGQSYLRAGKYWRRQPKVEKTPGFWTLTILTSLALCLWKECTSVALFQTSKKFLVQGVGSEKAGWER